MADLFVTIRFVGTLLNKLGRLDNNLMDFTKKSIWTKKGWKTVQLGRLQFSTGKIVPHHVGRYDAFHELMKCQWHYFHIIHLDRWYSTMKRCVEDRNMAWKFINLRLTSDDKPGLAKFIKKCKDDVGDCLRELAIANCKLSISWVDEKTAWCVTVSPTKQSKLNKDCSMSSWSDDWVEAIYMTGYKVLVLAESGSWEKIASSQEDWG